MVKIPAESETALRTGIVATRMAIANYATACRGLRRLPEARFIVEQLDLSVNRLEAMRHDLERRILPDAGQDAMFVALQVAQAGLSALTDAVGEMRESYSALQPHELPREGWFIDEEDAVQLADDVPTPDKTAELP